jgi:hypothetical protein
MSALGYAYEKLGAGVQILATHPDEIKGRLIAAFHDSLHAVPTDALPEQPKQIWIDVWAKVTAIKGTEQSGVFAPSINAMDESEAVQIARMITTVETMVQSDLDI